MNDETVRTFPGRVLLSALAGRILTRPRDGHNGVCDLIDFLDWMTGESLYPYQLGRAAAECAPHLLRHFPELGGADLAALDAALRAAGPGPAAAAAAVEAWLAAQHGVRDSYDVPRLRGPRPGPEPRNG